MSGPNGILVKETDGGYQPERQIMLKECTEDEGRRFVDVLMANRKASLRMNQLKEEINRAHKPQKKTAKSSDDDDDEVCEAATEHGPRRIKTTRYAWYPQAAGIALLTLEPGQDPDDENEEDYG
jgi:hypothetical protein